MPCVSGVAPKWGLSWSVICAPGTRFVVIHKGLYNAVRRSMKGAKLRPVKLSVSENRPEKDLNLLMHSTASAEGGNRTHTGATSQRFLRPSRLPFRHFGRHDKRVYLRMDSPSSSFGHRLAAD